MSKIKKWIYPLIFLISSFVGFLLFYFLLLALVTSKIVADGWGALFVFLIAILLWGFIILPIYCFKYGKLVKAERFGIGFVFYNACVIVAPLFLPFVKYEEAYGYGFISFLWVLAWAAFPLLSAQEIRKKEEHAKTVLFAAADVTADDVSDLTVTTENDKTLHGWKFCIRFTAGNVTYRGEVNGNNGELIDLTKGE